jgi:peptidyl-prolyl cis-trans isomerase C
MTKYGLFVIFAFTASLCAQAPQPQAQPPQAQPPQAQAAAAPIPPDTVVATLEGRKFTYGDFERFLRSLPPQAQQAFQRDRKSLLQQIALMMRLSSEAEKAQLDQKGPYKEQLEIARMNILAQANINEKFSTFRVGAEDQQKYYEANKDRYGQVKVKVLYVAFSNAPAPASAPKKPLSEAEAKAKIEKLLAEARGGADFVKLVKANSDDATSSAKDGDFGSIKKTDNIPEPIKATIFALKPGEISQPVRQPNGFYLFRAEEITAQSYPEVKDQIFTELKQAKFKEWLEGVRANLDITIQNQDFLKTAPAPPSLAAPARR